MISTTGLEVRAGSSLLLENASLRVAKGDRIGLVGRNGAGKTTLTRILAQETQPAGGTVSVSGTVGYLPQDPRSGNPDEIARDRIAIYLAGGIRRGTDMLKSLALGADAVWVGRAVLYGLGAAGAAGASRALDILKSEASDAMGLLGVNRISELNPRLLTNVRSSAMLTLP